ncbi:MAG: Protein of unknown function (DUF1153) [Rhodobacteraceae bacterium HLUCCA12]|nr:MAG: Protein of unknown function (DUF1153) [Rhodobacteraceae bacterium HLUCCA12]
MYLKKIDGPRAVTLPDGSILSHADLPPAGLRRWVASRKAVVVHAVAHGLVTRDEVLARYDLSEEEFDAWCRGFQAHGLQALKVTALQKFRQ